MLPFCGLLLALLSGPPAHVAAVSAHVSGTEAGQFTVELPERKVGRNITGHLIDSSGEAIAGAVVKVLDLQRRPVTQQVSSADGAFVLHNLRPGRFRLLITMQNFCPLEVPIDVRKRAEATHLTLTMKVGV